MMFLLEHIEVRSTLDTLRDESESLISNDITDNEDTQHSEDQSEDIIEYTVCDDGILTPTIDKECTATFLATPRAATSKQSKVHRYDDAPKPKKSRCNDEQQLLQGATMALTNISSSFNNHMKSLNSSKNQTGPISDNDILAKFITTKLNMITDPNVRLHTEQEIISLLYDGIKRCGEIK